MKVSIILPTYNEAGNISQLIKTINCQKELKEYQLEFVVVDDNSPDHTAAIVKALTKKIPVKLFVRTKQKGLASAILYGIRKSRGQIIVLMDTDFNHQPKDIANLITPIIDQQADLVIGSRYIKGGGMHLSEASRWQYWLSRWGNYFVNRWLLNLPVHESLSGFVAVRKKILARLNLEKIFSGYGEYCIRLIYYCHRRGFKIKEIPVMYGFRQYGISKSSLKRMIYFYLKTALQLRFS